MPMVGFDSQPFSVLVDDNGRLPMPVRNDDGPDSYTATVIIASGTIFDAIAALRSRVTPVTAMGMFGGVLVTEAGPGPKVLVYPTGNGAEASRYAVLVDFQGSPFADRDGGRTADVTFLLGDAP